jgi:hypothetical protein
MQRLVAILASIILALSGAGVAEACVHSAESQSHAAAGHGDHHGDHGAPKKAKGDCCPDDCSGGLSCKACVASAAISAPEPATYSPSPVAAIDPDSDDIGHGDSRPGEPPPPRS